MRLERIISDMSLLCQRLPRYKEHKEVHDRLEEKFLVLLERLRLEHGCPDVFYEMKHWYMNYKGVENI